MIYKKTPEKRRSQFKKQYKESRKICKGGMPRNKSIVKTWSGTSRSCPISNFGDLLKFVTRMLTNVPMNGLCVQMASFILKNEDYDVL